MLFNDQKQFLRHKVLEFFALRARAAFAVKPVAEIMRYRQIVDFRFEIEDLEEAVQFLHKLGHLDVQEDSFGAGKYYQISPTGTLKYERGDTDGTAQ